MATDRTEVLIRPAETRDIKELSRMEKRVCGHLGTEVYGARHFKAWLEVHPAGFWVGECQGLLAGYVYGQFMDFSLKDADRIVSCDTVTDHGYTRRTHNPQGDSLYGMSVTSIRPGAGKLLINALYGMVEARRKKCYFAFPRISGFAQYVDRLKNLGVCGILQPEEEYELALWYTLGCAKLAGEKVWDVCGPRPKLDLPAPGQPDPVLNWHLRHWQVPGKRLGILKLLHNFMPDPQSLDYTVMICSDLPGLG